MAQDMIHAVILAGGASRRFQSATPKVLFPLLGKPLLQHVIENISSLNCREILVVVPSSDARVREWVRTYNPGIQCVDQASPKGTGDALRCAVDFLSSRSKRGANEKILVLSGDVPTVQEASLTKLLDSANEAGSLLVKTVQSTREAFGYGRILRHPSKKNWVSRIVEEKDATSKERLIREINLGIYCFGREFLEANLAKLKDKNAQGEFYLTDLVALVPKWKAKSKGLAIVDTADPVEGLGANTRVELAHLQRRMLTRQIETWMEKGVEFDLPETVYVEGNVTLSERCRIGPNVHLIGPVSMGARSVVEGCSLIRASHLESGVVVKWGSVVEDSTLKENSQVGPLARLRGGTVLEAHSEIGNFVEVKKSIIGKSSKAKHLSYLGDAQVGSDVNIGCGVITCNYDGISKHATRIEDGAFIGSDSQLIAPITVGAGAYIASGTTVTTDVEPGALAIGRVKQETKKGFAEKLLKRRNGPSA